MAMISLGFPSTIAESSRALYRYRQNPKYSDAELRQIYATPHEHSKWEDHVNRVEQTIALARRNAMYGRIADLSCGDAVIALTLSTEAVLGDFAPGYEYQGEILDTLPQIPFVDVFVLCETLEHMDDPDLVLQRVRHKTRQLLLSTPVCDGPDGNPEHYWVWDREGVEDMLANADFSVIDYAEAYNGMGYRFGIWGCR